MTAHHACWRSLVVGLPAVGALVVSVLLGGCGQGPSLGGTTSSEVLSSSSTVTAAAEATTSSLPSPPPSEASPRPGPRKSTRFSATWLPPANP